MVTEAWCRWVIGEDVRYYTISHPLRYDSGRGRGQVGLVYERDFTGRRADDLFSGYTRERTQEETDRETEAYLFGYVQRMEVSEFADRTEVMPKLTHRLQRTAKGADRNGGLKMAMGREDAWPPR